MLVYFMPSFIHPPGRHIKLLSLVARQEENARMETDGLRVDYIMGFIPGKRRITAAVYIEPCRTVLAGKYGSTTTTD